ncbi:MAG: sodium-translocating pyrophosphatase, partial [Candidatus Magasanikbacteria bacterium]|nr:sodium-translocating pyrophosphatase [Candidatus Magasanikbacteria bacterium]
MTKSLIWAVLGSAVVSLTFAWIFFQQMKKEKEDSRTVSIASFIREGATAYLRQQYTLVGKFLLLLTIIFAGMAYIGLQNYWVPFAFLSGAFFSGLAGFCGMKAATYANSRVASAAITSLNKGFIIAFRSGAVMGLTVVGLALLDISVWFLILSWAYPNSYDTHTLIIITTTMLTFGMGASTQALFARVGGGIFTKAADVGADLVGKLEAGIPEDDPRNPAVIADNVGDNVGDIAGMGADLYESYVGSILATASLGAVAFMVEPAIQLKAVLAPMLIAGAGNIISIFTIYMVKTGEKSGMHQLLQALNRGLVISSVLISVVTFPIIFLLDIPNWFGISFAVTIGICAGIIIGKSTEYFTSHEHSPVKRLAESSKTGPGTVIIAGLGLGMISVSIPVLTIVSAILLAYFSAIQFDIANMLTAQNLILGLYGIGIAAVGMLSTLGFSLATDAYGPIADNAGGITEIAKLGKEVRKRTDSMDAAGNTTAAIGKGFATGSGALTALALLSAYIEEVKMSLIIAGEKILGTIPIEQTNILDFMNHYKIYLINPKVLIGIFVGVMLCFVFSGITMLAVGRAAQSMVQEVRRQFKEIVGIMEGTGKPDYARCVEISTKGAQKEMVFPSMIAIMTPVIVGLVLGVPGIVGLLVGTISAGFVFSIFMTNAGGAWDNAKKYIEEGNLDGKGSDCHKAAIVGDTVGNPFKDTSGPSLNILIKLEAMVSIVTVGLAVEYSIYFEKSMSWFYTHVSTLLSLVSAYASTIL